MEVGTRRRVARWRDSLEERADLLEEGCGRSCGAETGEFRLHESPFATQAVPVRPGFGQRRAGLVRAPQAGEGEGSQGSAREVGTAAVETTGRPSAWRCWLVEACGSAK